MNKKLIAAAEEFKNWFVNDALPLWSSKAIDASCGASYERLLASGEPDLSASVRVRVQARQMFVFSLAAELAWYEGARQVVDRMAGFVRSNGRHISGAGYVHLLDSRYRTIDSKQDLYDHAFHLLANAWRYRVFKDASALTEMTAIMSLLDSKLAAPTGGWLEGDYLTDCRRQNPHMHLFEAFIASYEATGDELWLKRADAMFELFEQHFYNAEYAALLEYFQQDWAPLANEKGAVIEPGHMMEWVWLLRNYAVLRGKNVDNYANALYHTALKQGMAENGLLYDELELGGKIKKASKRCWPMTELIKASIAQARVGHHDSEAIAAGALQALKKHYLSVPLAGSYIDQLDEKNCVAVDFAPASTLYHLIVAAAEAIRYVQNK